MLLAACFRLSRRDMVYDFVKRDWSSAQFASEKDSTGYCQLLAFFNSVLRQITVVSLEVWSSLLVT